MHGFITWAYAIIGACLLVGFVPSIWDFARAWDIKFDKQVAEENGRKINWAKARKQQVVVPFLGLPLGLVVLGLLAYNYWVDFTWRAYTFISIAWFLSAVLRRLWLIAISIKVEHVMHRYGFRAAEPYRLGTWVAIKDYYRRGMARKHNPYRRNHKVFIGRLRWLNKISWLWLWVRHIRVALPILTEALVSLIWPFTAMFMVFYHSHEAADGLTISPWWARD